MANVSFLVSWCMRLLCLAAAAFFTIAGPVPPLLLRALRAASPEHADAASALLARAMPGASPLAILASATAARSWSLAAAWCILPLLFLLLALWRGRVFCRHVCPFGTCQALASRIGARRIFFPWRINGFLFWGIVFGGLAGLPFLLPLDPLATFNRALHPLSTVLFPRVSLGADATLETRLPSGIAAWIAGGVLPLFLLLSAVQPMIWCAKFCPLGYLFDLVRRLRPKAAAPARAADAPADPLRRELLVGAAAALLLIPLLRRFRLPGSGVPPAPAPILPPGAGSLDRFAGACTRCYACVQKCPTQVIRAGTPRAAELGAAFLPVLDMERGVCKQFCSTCTQACPVGALAPMRAEEKDRLQIGVARIERGACIAWSDGEHCMVCQEFCPYGAISIAPSEAGIPRPVVNEAVCRGCGACQNQCPALHHASHRRRAIVVHGLPVQAPARDAS